MAFILHSAEQGSAQQPPPRTYTDVLLDFWSFGKHKINFDEVHSLQIAIIITKNVSEYIVYSIGSICCLLFVQYLKHEGNMPKCNPIFHSPTVHSEPPPHFQAPKSHVWMASVCSSFAELLKTCQNNFYLHIRYTLLNVLALGWYLNVFLWGTV